MCGKKISPLGVELSSSSTGMVAIKKSPRSLYRHRSPITERPAVQTGETRPLPWNGRVTPVNNELSCRKKAVWPAAGIVTDIGMPARLPFMSVNSRLTMALLTPAFAIAIPVRMDSTCPKSPQASAKMRTACDVGGGIKPFCVTVTPSRTNENTVEAIGVIRSEEHTSELQSHSFISYAVF